MKHSELKKSDVDAMIAENGRIALIGQLEEARKQFFEGAITSEEYINFTFKKIADAHGLVPVKE